MTDNGEHVQAVTTIDDHDAALALARGAVAERLAACAQVTGPMTSVYRWEGEIAQATEWACVFKTTAARVDGLAAWLARTHPYDTPELIVTPIVGGARDYLAWVAAETAEH